MSILLKEYIFIQFSKQGQSLVKVFNDGKMTVLFPCLLNSRINIKEDLMKQIKEYFIKFPNQYIQGDIKKNFGISRKFYIIYILIDKYRSYEDYSWLTIRKVLNFYGYKTNKNKPKAVYEILDVLEYMIHNKMIEVVQDLNLLSYDSVIEIKIIPENFDYSEKFGKITSFQYDAIMMADTSLNRESILMVFLYINSYIGCRKKNDDSAELPNPEKYPEAFWKSMESMAKDLAMSKETIKKCIDYLTTSSDNRPALLIKREVGSVQPDKTKPPQNIPNIYVLNKEGYQQEIEWAINKLLEVYGIKRFNTLKGGNKE